MPARVFCLRNELQIFNSVIAFIFINVVDDLAGQKGAAYVLFHDNAVLVATTHFSVPQAGAAIPLFVAVVLAPSTSLFFWR